MNAGLSMSAAGRQTLATREGQGGGAANLGGHYDDSANNCTVGVGILVHHGPCTAAELAQRADANANDTEFNRRVHRAESAVRNGVNARQLNQNQFDALVSASFNSGNQLDPALIAANTNNDTAVAVHLRQLVMVHNHDAHGHMVGPPTLSRGLVNRRAGEITQYNTPISPVTPGVPRR